MNIAKYQILSLAFIITLLSACKTDTPSSTPQSDNALNSAQQAYKSDPNLTTGNAYIQAITQLLSTTDVGESKRSELLLAGINTATEQNLTSRKGAFLFPYIRDNGSANGIENKLHDLATLMKSMQKPAAADVLFKGVANRFPNFKSKAELEGMLSEPIESLEDYVTNIGASIFENPDDTGINRSAALQYVDVCEAYALVNPQAESTPEFLFKAAEVAKSIQTFTKSLSIYDWLIEKYPSYEKTPTSMFLKGFIIENNLGSDSLALVAYNDFIAKYPNDDLVDDAQFLIQNLGKSDEEILEMIEERQKQNQQKNQ